MMIKGDSVASLRIVILMTLEMSFTLLESSITLIENTYSTVACTIKVSRS